MTGPALDIQQLTVLRPTDEGSRRVVENLSLQIGARRRLALIGPNGAGKTSLLLALVGAVPFEGSIAVAGLKLTRATLAEVRRRVLFVFSDPRDQLFLPTVRAELEFGPEQRGRSPDWTALKVTEVLNGVGLAGFEQRAPRALSLGEQRRLAIATALTCEPDVILLDEPTSNLDPVARRGMLRLLAGLDATIVLATHDLDAALELDADVALLNGGRLLTTGAARQLLTDEPLLERAGLALPLSLSGRR